MNDIHKQRGKEAAKEIRDWLEDTLEGPEALIDIAMTGIAKSIERSEIARARERRKRAEKHRQTRDLFE